MTSISRPFNKEKRDSFYKYTGGMSPKMNLARTFSVRWDEEDKNVDTTY